jgi:hypothetical protein
MERGVTELRPMRAATLDCVLVEDFLVCFALGWPSASSGISSAADDGDVKIDLNA